jgi:hypothetical protein
MPNKPKQTADFEGYGHSITYCHDYYVAGDKYAVAVMSGSFVWGWQ